MTSLRLLLYNTALLTNPVPSHRFQISRYYQMFLFLIYRNCIFLKTCILFMVHIWLKYTCVILSVFLIFSVWNYILCCILKIMKQPQQQQLQQLLISLQWHLPRQVWLQQRHHIIQLHRFKCVILSQTYISSAVYSINDVCVWGMMLCKTSSAVLNYIKKTLLKKRKTLKTCLISMGKTIAAYL